MIVNVSVLDQNYHMLLMTLVMRLVITISMFTVEHMIFNRFYDVTRGGCYNCTNGTEPMSTDFKIVYWDSGTINNPVFKRTHNRTNRDWTSG
jgi:hypothetical protein